MPIPAPDETDSQWHANLDADVLFAAVGRALSAWEHLESILAIIYSALVGKPRQLPAMQRYRLNRPGLDARLKGLTVALDEYCPTSPSQDAEAQLKSEIAIILNRVECLKPWRNHVAHGIVQTSASHTFNDANEITTHVASALWAPMYAIPVFLKEGANLKPCGSKKALWYAANFNEVSAAASAICLRLCGPG